MKQLPKKRIKGRNRTKNKINTRHESQLDGFMGRSKRMVNEISREDCFVVPSRNDDKRL